ncbi:MAG: ABC transporter ATP-binding protein [bacterium]
MLKATNIRYSSGKGTHKKEILRNVSFEVEEGESLYVSGKSGVGKTTLLSILGLLLNPTSGQVLIRQEPLLSLTAKEKSWYRQTKIGLIFQEPYFIQDFTIYENISLATIFQNIPKQLLEKQIIDYMVTLDLHMPLETSITLLSGGEKRRIAIIRALIQKPKILIADEPLENLDDQNQERVTNLLDTYVAQEKAYCIIASHKKRKFQKSICLEKVT